MKTFNDALSDVFSLKLTAVTMHCSVLDRRNQEEYGTLIAEFVETESDEKKMENKAMESIRTRLNKLGYDVTFYTTPSSFNDCTFRPEYYAKNAA